MAYSAVESLPDKDIYYSFPSARKAAFSRTQVQTLILTTIQLNRIKNSQEGWKITSSLPGLFAWFTSSRCPPAASLWPYTR
jgi:hypothetical protein